MFRLIGDRNCEGFCQLSNQLLDSRIIVYPRPTMSKQLKRVLALGIVPYLSVA
jgi:hypothetical protein